MKRNIHAVAGVLAFLFIATFWTSTVVSELFLDHRAVSNVKVAITYAFIAFIPCMAITGANGLLVLIPAAIFLSIKAQAGEFDTAFYTVQVLELLAGATNLFLMGMNIRAGRQMGRQHQKK